MGWLANKINDWAVGKQKSEFEKWHGALSAMNGDEIGALVAAAADARNNIKRVYGVDLLEPVIAMTLRPNLVMELHGMIRGLQGTGGEAGAAGLMVWLFTLRAASAAEMRWSGRTLWRTLSRGFPHADQAAMDFFGVTGKLLNIDDFDSFPTGMEPEPVD